MTDLKEGELITIRSHVRSQMLIHFNYKCLAVTPKLAHITDDTQDAIHEMKEQLLKDLAKFRKEMDTEVHKTLDEVSALREQKKMLQADLSDLLAFKSKVSTIPRRCA